MTDAQWRYLSQLTRALQEEGMKGRRIGDHVAELASHIETTDTDPVEEFGTPHELARALACDDERIPAWVVGLPVRLTVLAFATGGAVLVVAAVLNDPAVVTLGSVFYAVGLGLLIVAFRRVATIQLDGRSLASMITVKSTVVLLVGAGVVSWAGTSGTVIATLPRATAITVGSVLIVVGLGVASAIGDKVRFPDHAQHLNRLTRPMSRRPSAL